MMLKMPDSSFKSGISASTKRIGIGTVLWRLTKPRTLWPRKLESIFSKTRKVKPKRKTAEQLLSIRKGNSATF